MARQLVAALSGEFDATRYRDEYREALLSVIEAKVAGQPLEVPTQTEAEPSKLTDLMAVLEASVAAARAEARRASATDGGDAGDAAAETSRVGLHCAKGRSGKARAAASATDTSRTASTARRRKSA